MRFRMIVFLSAISIMAVSLLAEGTWRGSNRARQFSVTTTDGGADLNDTIVVSVYNKMYDYNAVTGVVIVGAAASTNRGFGLSDSAKILIESELKGITFTISTSTFTSIPCTLKYSSPPNLGIGDTLFKKDLSFRVIVTDTTADSIMTTTYPITWDFILRE